MMKHLLALILLMVSPLALAAGSLEAFYTNLEGRWVGNKTEYVYKKMKNGDWEMQTTYQDSGGAKISSVIAYYRIRDENLFTLTLAEDGTVTGEIPSTLVQVTPTVIVDRWAGSTIDDYYFEFVTEVDPKVKITKINREFEKQVDGLWKMKETRLEYLFAPLP